MLTSTDRAGNAQRSRFQFFIPSARHVTDHDQLDNPPTHDQPPHFGQPMQADVWSWGSVGSGGGWGSWSYPPGSGGSGDGTFTPTLVGPAQPVGLPAAPQSGTAPLSGSGYEYAESIRDIVDRAVDFISVSPETATKKAALDHRKAVLQGLGQRLDTLIHRDGDFYNDWALVERLRPVMQGLFAAAYDPRNKGTYTDGSPIDRAGVEPAFADLEAGWLAQSVVRDPLSVRVQVFQATLLEVVTEATLGVTDVNQQKALAAAVMALAQTYAWLNPNPEATVPVADKDFGFLDALWRLQIPDANGVFKDSGVIAQTLENSVAALERLLAGVQDPVRAMQFLNNLVQVATNVTSLKGDVKDAQFLRELVEFGVEFVKTNPENVSANSSEDFSESFLKSIWQNVSDHKVLEDLNNLFDGVSSGLEKISLLQFVRHLFTDARQVPIALQPEYMQASDFLDSLADLASAFFVLNSTQAPDLSSTSLTDFIANIWSLAQENGLAPGEPLKDLLPLASFLRLERKSVMSNGQIIVANSSEYSEYLIAALPDKLGIKVAQRALRWLATKGDDISVHVIKHHLARNIYLKRTKFIGSGSSVKKLAERVLKEPDNVVQGGSVWIYEKEFGRSLGTKGEKIIRVIVWQGTGKISTVYPTKFFTTKLGSVAFGAAILAATRADAAVLSYRENVQRSREQGWIEKVIDFLNPIDSGSTAIDEDIIREGQIIDSEITRAISKIESRTQGGLSEDEKQLIRESVIFQMQTLNNS